MLSLSKQFTDEQVKNIMFDDFTALETMFQSDELQIKGSLLCLTMSMIFKLIC